MQHPTVFEPVVIAATDESGISKCKAYVVLRRHANGDEVLAAELKSFVKERLAPFKRPHHVEFVVELHKTSTGKIQHFRLRELSAKALRP